VHRAFELLKNEGLIENKVGSGSYVRFPQNRHPLSDSIDLRTDYLNECFFPYTQAQTIFNQLFSMEKAHALAPTPVEGDPELIRVLSRHYHLPADRMLIISGAQQGLDLVSKVFAAKISESILFEDPTYPGAISLFRARHFVPLENDGPDLRQFDHGRSSQIKLFYAMPSVHNPTGISYSKAKKEAVAERARKHDFFVIEDDYLGELKTETLRFIDIAPERTIHIKSFAQTTIAGIRLGLMVVPEKFYEQFANAKYSSDISSSGLLQKFLREFIKQGLYDRHIKSIQKQIAKRRKLLEKLIDQFTILSYAPNQSGYSIWVDASKEIRRPDLPWSPGPEFSFSQNYKPFFRIAFMHTDDVGFAQSLNLINNIMMRYPL
jgi:DNA-binding transcriptional MocR family regulator